MEGAHPPQHNEIMTKRTVRERRLAMTDELWDITKYLLTPPSICRYARIKYLALARDGKGVFGLETSQHFTRLQRQCIEQKSLEFSHTLKSPNGAL